MVRQARVVRGTTAPETVFVSENDAGLHETYDQARTAERQCTTWSVTLLSPKAKIMRACLKKGFGLVTDEACGVRLIVRAPELLLSKGYKVLDSGKLSRQPPSRCKKAPTDEHLLDVDGDMALYAAHFNEDKWVRSAWVDEATIKAEVMRAHPDVTGITVERSDSGRE
jgi:hypothetical protein